MPDNVDFGPGSPDLDTPIPVPAPLQQGRLGLQLVEEYGSELVPLDLQTRTDWPTDNIDETFNIPGLCCLCVTVSGRCVADISVFVFV